ncbi:MAG TPA: class I SAM-dependent methyltransferase [Oligoflexia bacterium]|nr:class I SAM-dependent methyltransferase [Oligoflexia bacterium]HMP49850.1 class I SAM-dependent methyltransferase [Oligoflexia bacterium]
MSVLPPRLADSIIFDQYSRYNAVAQVVRMLDQAGEDKGRVGKLLDVGSGPYCLLADFLPDSDITFLDPLLSSIKTSHRIITESFFDLNIENRDRQFNTVVSIDTFEHIPPELRDDFLSRCSRLASDYLILGFPSSDTNAAYEVDQEVHNQYYEVFGSEYLWLKEHREYGLPSAKDTATKLNGMGWNISMFGNGRIEWLYDLLPLIVLLNEFPDMKLAVQRISAKFNKEFAPFDFCSTGYRVFIVASRNASPDGFSFIKSEPSDLNKKWASLKKEVFLECIKSLKNSVLSKIDNFGGQVQELNNALFKQGEWGKSLEFDIKSRDAEINRLNAVLAEQSEWTRVLTRDIEIRDAEIFRLQDLIKNT